MRQTELSLSKQDRQTLDEFRSKGMTWLANRIEPTSSPPAGACNLFVAVEPKGARRVLEVTGRRTKDFVNFVRRLLTEAYAGASKVHLVLDNLNTHFRSSFEEVLGHKTASALLRRVEFHHTPKHASWLNMAEIECVNAIARGRGLRQFLVRGLRKVKAVAVWYALAHNLMRGVALAAPA